MSLTEIPYELNFSPAPITIIKPGAVIFVKRRKSPIMRTCNQAVLDRIVMDVIDMPIHIALIANDMIPKSFLPDMSSGGPKTEAILFGEREFYFPHDLGQVIAATLNQRMQMIGENGISDDIETSRIGMMLHGINQQFRVVGEESGSHVGHRCYKAGIRTVMES